MSKRTTLITAALGSAFAATAALAPVAHAAGNPFAASQLSAGYQLAQADTKMDGKKKDGSCGGDKKADANCGADKKAAGDKKKDGKCGEAKCGADKKK